MPQHLKDMLGERIGSLTVIGLVASSHEARWRCRCDCGREKTFAGSKLRRGEALCSCSGGHEEHGLSRSQRRLYKVWIGLKGRCSNVGDARYGGRGIDVCEEWRHSFAAFCSWALANGWRDGLEIDRRDNDGDYEPGNCRFVSAKINCRNKSSNRIIEFRGEARLLVEWSEHLGVPIKVLHNRLNAYGWSVERAFTTPHRTVAEAARSRHSERIAA